MLHSLPALLDDLERRLIAGEDPLPLLGSVRWPNVVGWPQDHGEAMRLKERVAVLTTLINGLQAPIQATLHALNAASGYGAKGSLSVPSSLSLRFSEHV